MTLTGKKGLVLGVANKRSLAWAIAKRASEAGADLALTFQGERLEENVRELAATLEREPLILPCDVTADDQVDALFTAIASTSTGSTMLLRLTYSFSPGGMFIPERIPKNGGTGTIDHGRAVGLSARCRPIID